MRKIIAVLLLLACLLTAIFMVGCEKKAETTTDTPATETAPTAFSGSAFDAMSNLKTKGTIGLVSSDQSWGVKLEEVSFGTTVIKDGVDSKYIGIFINTDDVNLIDLYGMCDPIVLDGVTYNYSGVTIDKITYKEGLKVLIALTEDSGKGDWTYVPVKGAALLFALPDGVEAKTLN